MRRWGCLLFVFVLSMSLTACSAKDALVDILSEAISKAMEKSQESVSEQTESEEIQENASSSQTPESVVDESQTDTTAAMDMTQLYECWSKVVGYWNAA